MFRLLDLFSGIGGFSLAASRVWGEELEIIAFCEIDKFCQSVLRKHWPIVPIIEDIREVTLEKIMDDSKSGGCGFRKTSDIGQNASDVNTPCLPSALQSSRIDLLTGGFPCQPASCAGKRQGTADSRWLWPEMLRVIHETSPAWIIAENVPGLLSLNGGLEFESMCASLENEGYEVQPFIIPACAVNAPHRRDRVWIVAHSERDGSGPRGAECPGQQGGVAPIGSSDVAHSQGRESGKPKTGNWWEGVNARSRRDFEFDVGQLADGLSSGLAGYWDREPNIPRVATEAPGRVSKLRALGNAIVPQVAARIMEAIKATS